MRIGLILTIFSCLIGVFYGLPKVPVESVISWALWFFLYVWLAGLFFRTFGAVYVTIRKDKF